MMEYRLREIKGADVILRHYIWIRRSGLNFYLEWILVTLFFSLGVLMWEVFTCGKVPYGRLKNSEVVDMVQRGQVLEKPKGCLPEIYNVSLSSSGPNANPRRLSSSTIIV